MQTSGNEKNNKTKETNSGKHASETHFITCYTSIITIWCKEMIVIGQIKKRRMLVQIEMTETLSKPTSNMIMKYLLASFMHLKPWQIIGSLKRMCFLSHGGLNCKCNLGVQKLYRSGMVQHIQSIDTHWTSMIRWQAVFSCCL